MRLLEVDDLTVTFRTADGVVQAVRGVTFGADRGQTLGIVGESGSGKSVAMQSMLGISLGARVRGSARFEGRDLLKMSEEELRAVRGAKISMIFQDPLTSLHPHYRVGWQIVEMIREHQQVTRAQARRQAVDLLGQVGIAQPARRADEFPHQFSGGMRQRAMIAMALANNPALLIADEPTTALDATVQAQIIELLMRLQAELGTAVIIITHDLGVVAQIADEVLVMYAGRAVEKAGRRTTFYEAHHPYTRGLLRSIPSSAASTDRLQPIPGSPPSLLRVPPGCAFHPRCPFAMDRCRHEEPPLKPVLGVQGHESACWLPSDLVGQGDAVDAERLAYAMGHGHVGARGEVAG